MVGAIFCLGSAGLVVLVDSRWTTLRLMLQVEMLMVTLTLVGAVRARAEFDQSRALTWLLLSGFIAVLLGSVYLWYAMDKFSRIESPLVVFGHSLGDSDRHITDAINTLSDQLARSDGHTNSLIILERMRTTTLRPVPPPKRMAVRVVHAS